MTDSVQYYSDNAASFFERTADANVSALYDTFIQRVPQGGRILDAGCGSGRDSLAFSKLGYDVEAIDASEQMAELARAHTDLAIHVTGFNEMEYVAEFDGIWACASLLHVSRADSPEVFERFVRALKPGGCWFLSYKYGDDEVERDGRLFSNHTERSLATLLDPFPLCNIDMRISQDVRLESAEALWLNALVTLMDEA